MVCFCMGHKVKNFLEDTKKFNKIASAMIKLSFLNVVAKEKNIHLYPQECAL